MGDDRPISEVERANYWLELSDVDSVEEGITWGLIDDLAREIERLEAENEMFRNNWLAVLSDYNNLLEDKTNE